MAISRSKKEAVVEKIKRIISSSKTIVFVHFKNVTSEETNLLRNACAEGEVGYTVARKTLIKKAFDGGGVKGDFPELEGEIAVAYSSDILASAQVIGEQGKSLGNRVEIVGGIFENAFISKEEMNAIANIPPIKTLYAQFLTVIQSPVQGCASVLSQIANKK